ncbi:hypothetical protein BCR44DRAFT_1459855 [Catenaria anguillulae PL171]|uniref:Peptidase C14 caspase domain-containing protein n=1 Tax=Catenaria anguillulae PL171 TaxID=765915 RepID=A0A1Y2HRT3_9FUNG|nr:hypothetical protein BCR44DRAFT_1459855 [Catenaria anguillulae PL171]
MPNAALVLGMTCPDHPSVPHTPVFGPASANMVDLVDSTGIYGKIDYLTDKNGQDVTRDDILSALRDMVAQAEPGDQLMFSALGYGGQVPVAEGSAECEADGMNEVMWASDGPILDSEIREILGELPAGVDMTLAFDQQSAGTLADLDVGSLDANIVCIASSADGETAYGTADNTTFVSEFEAVLQEHPDYTWSQVAAEINARIPHDQAQTVNVSASNNELLDTPIFSGSLAAHTNDATNDLAAAQAAADDEADDADHGHEYTEEEPPLEAKGGSSFGSAQANAENAGAWLGELLVALKDELAEVESKPMEPLPEELQGFDNGIMM